MLYIFYGQDDFSLRQTLAGIQKNLGDPELLAANTTVISGQQLTLNDLKRLCDTAPFLSLSRLIIVEGLLGRFEPRPGTKRRDPQVILESKSKEVAEWRALSSYVKEMPATTVLILVDSKLSKENALLKTLSSTAEIINFPLLKGKVLRDWIYKRVTEGGGTISREAINLLAELIGGDLWVMDREIEKLLLFNRSRPIMPDDIRQLVTHAREANVFALVDAILEGQSQEAHRLLHWLIKGGMSPSSIMVMITRQLRLIVRAKELIQELPRAEVKDALGLTSDYGLDKTLNQAKLYTLQRLREVYHKLLETDLSIKTGKHDGDLALDLLITELCQS